MGATAAVHPADPILQAYGLGRLDDVSSRSVSKHLDGCDSCQRRVAELSSDEFLDRLQNAQVKPDRAVFGWSPSAASSTEGTVALRSAAAGRHTASRTGRPPRLRDHPRAGPRRHGRRLPGPEQAHGPPGSAQGRQRPPGRAAAASSTASSARSATRPSSTTPTSSPPTRPCGSARASSWPWSTSRASTWRRLVKAQGPLPVAHACYFIHQAALGLQHAHEHGMVHRDIKPGNLMLAREGKTGDRQGPRLRPGQGRRARARPTAA